MTDPFAAIEIIVAFEGRTAHSPAGITTVFRAIVLLFYGAAVVVVVVEVVVVVSKTVAEVLDSVL